MNIEELCKQYGLQQEELLDYIKFGIITNELTDSDMKKIGTLILLKKSGLCREQRINYFSLDESKQGKEMKMIMLRELRESVLNSVHDKQKLLDKIDYILYELKRKG